MFPALLRGAGVVMVLLGVAGILDHLRIFAFHAPFIDWMRQWGRTEAWAVEIGVAALGLWLLLATPSGDERHR